jgi:hypothetical protein
MVSLLTRGNRECITIFQLKFQKIEPIYYYPNEKHHRRLAQEIF